MNFQVNDIISVRRKHLYWVQQGSHTLNAVVGSTSDNAEQVVRARVLRVEQAPRWGNMVFLAVENEIAPEGSALAALCRNCSRE